MQNEKISIIDYGLGNIESLKNAIKKIGYIPDLYSTNSIINSNIAIIPGVGSFNYAMKLIISKNIDKEINKFVSKDSNFLIGICLGMQLLFESSTEIDLSTGLGLMKGKIVGDLLDEAFDLQLNSKLKNREEGLEWLEKRIEEIKAEEDPNLTTVDANQLEFKVD